MSSGCTKWVMLINNTQEFDESCRQQSKTVIVKIINLQISNRKRN